VLLVDLHAALDHPPAQHALRTTHAKQGGKLILKVRINVFQMEK
jgi:hypothetical protein